MVTLITQNMTNVITNAHAHVATMDIDLVEYLLGALGR